MTNSLGKPISYLACNILSVWVITTRQMTTVMKAREVALVYILSYTCPVQLQPYKEQGLPSY